MENIYDNFNAALLEKVLDTGRGINGLTLKEDLKYSPVSTNLNFFKFVSDIGIMGALSQAEAKIKFDRKEKVAQVVEALKNAINTGFYTNEYQTPYSPIANRRFLFIGAGYGDFIRSKNMGAYYEAEYKPKEFTLGDKESHTVFFFLEYISGAEYPIDASTVFYMDARMAQLRLPTLNVFAPALHDALEAAKDKLKNTLDRPSSKDLIVGSW